jgi:hypothetical protein
VTGGAAALFYPWGSSNRNSLRIRSLVMTIKKPAGWFSGLFLFFALVPLAAQETARPGAGEAGAGSAVTRKTILQLQISSLPEAKFRGTESLTFPLLRGSGPLTAGNDLRTDFSGELTPVSLNGIAEAVWTPIAFFQLSGGGRIGTGWNMALGNGIGVTRPVGTVSPPAPRKREVDGDPFGGFTWNLYGGGALQFDLGALIPGDWNHLVFRSYHEGRYRSFTGAKAGEPWIFENDDGENLNGWTYYGCFILGYQMPASPVFRALAFMAELDKSFYHSPGGELWGEDRGRWTFSTLFNFVINPRLDLSLVIQMRTRRNYGDGDLNNQGNYYFRDRKIDDDAPHRLVFYRAALILSYTLEHTADNKD